MFKNYFKIAIRNLSKNKVFTVINIAGLTAGLSCCLLMVLYLQNELSFDKFHEKGDRIARVIMEYSFNNSKVEKGNFTSTKVLPAFERNFSEVESGVRLNPTTRLVKYDNRVFNEKNFLYADSTFFKIFSFQLLEGKADEVLKSPNTVVITKSMAKKYFDDEKPVGKVLHIGNQQESFLVTGLIEDSPNNSQLKFDFVASFSSNGPAQTDSYFNANFTTYLLLKDENSISSLQAKIGPFMKSELKDEPGVYINYELEPLTKIHLYSPYDAIVPNNSITYVYIIGGVALLVLLIACFTYINLSTARSMERAKEVGIRKVAGAYKSQVFWQFISESFLVTLISLVLSIVLAVLLLPLFSTLTGTTLSFFNLAQPAIIAVTIFLVLAIATLAGSYPAFVLSQFQPTKVLKGAFKNTTAGDWLKKSLITFQFIVSVFLIIATIIIGRQLQYIQHKKLGYNREHIIVSKIDQKTVDRIDFFKSELKKRADIKAVSKAYETPVSIIGGYTMSGVGQGEMSVIGNPIDEEYIKANGLEIVVGSDFTRQDVLNFNDDTIDKSVYTPYYIINESAAKSLGWTQANEAVGEKIILMGELGLIKAVVKDFHFASLHSPIVPLVLFPGGWGNTLIVKTSGEHLPQTIDFLKKTWKEFMPDAPFEYHFMDEEYQQLYQTEKRTGYVFNIFSGIAIFLACLGLFGLSAYAAKQRIKEIGVRKVLGASISNIALLLSGSFLKWVAIAFVISTPLAWWLMNLWLQGFAYRIDIQWWMFALAGLMAVLIAVLTVSFQAIKAAIANPVDSLRNE